MPGIRNILTVIAVAVATAHQMPAQQTDTVPAAVSMRAVQAVDSVHRAAQRPLDLPGLNLVRDLQPDLRTLQPLEIDKNALDRRFWAKPAQQSIYDMPYSRDGKCYDWRRLWINTGVLAGAFVGTLFVLEMLPEDATSWNRASLQDIPLFTRWRQHVIDEGPEWDHDKFVFNYVLHPYAGAVYFMAARSNGFNFWQSLLYSTCISTIGWEFGIEAFMERPSYQDLFITPLVGSSIGEAFYRVKRHLVNNGYCLLGSPVLGNIVAFLIDPVNEVVGLFDHNPARRVARQNAGRRRAQIALTPGFDRFALTVTF